MILAGVQSLPFIGRHAGKKVSGFEELIKKYCVSYNVATTLFWLLQGCHNLVCLLTRLIATTLVRILLPCYNLVATLWQCYNLVTTSTFPHGSSHLSTASAKCNLYLH